MDGTRFNELVRELLAGASRRGFLRGLSALPLAGGLAAFLLDDDESAAKKRKNKKKQRKKKQRKRKKKKRKPQEMCVCASGCPFTSVQAAIDAAGNGATITLCAGTFTGNLTIAKDLTIVGAGDDATTLQGDGNGTVVTIAEPNEEEEDTTVTIEQLRISGGAAEFGGGIFNGDTLTLSGCTVSGNAASFDGGGIANNGALTLTACTVSQNTAGSRGGGGIFNNVTATVEMNDCTVSGNSADFGGGIYNFGTVTLEAGTVVSGNDADDDGGGIYNDGVSGGGGGTSTCTGSSVSGNTAGDPPMPSDCVAVNGGSCVDC